MKTTRTTVVVDAIKVTDNGRYSVSYQYDMSEGNKTLLIVHVEVADKKIVNGTENYVVLGNMKFMNEQISISGFPFSDKNAMYMSEFSTIVDEVKELLK